jgi:hypothetical protein
MHGTQLSMISMHPAKHGSRGAETHGTAITAGMDTTFNDRTFFFPDYNSFLHFHDFYRIKYFYFFNLVLTKNLQIDTH